MTSYNLFNHNFFYLDEVTLHGILTLIHVIACDQSNLALNLCMQKNETKTITKKKLSFENNVRCCQTQVVSEIF